MIVVNLPDPELVKKYRQAGAVVEKMIAPRVLRRLRRTVAAYLRYMDWELGWDRAEIDRILREGAKWFEDDTGTRLRDCYPYYSTGRMLAFNPQPSPECARECLTVRNRLFTPAQSSMLVSNHPDMHKSRLFLKHGGWNPGPWPGWMICHRDICDQIYTQLNAMFPVKSMPENLTIGGLPV